MTFREYPLSLRPFALPTFLLALAFAAGCGGDSPKGTSPKVTLEAKVATRDDRPTDDEPAAKVEVQAGDVVQLIARITNSRPARGGAIELAFPVTGARTLRARVQAQGGSSRNLAELTARAGEVKLDDIRYTCRTPPLTFCPVRSAEIRKGAYQIVVPVPQGDVPIVFVANVVGGS